MKIYIKDYYTKEIFATVESEHVPRTNDTINIDNKRYKVSNEVEVFYFTNGDDPFATIVARDIS